MMTPRLRNVWSAIVLGSLIAVAGCGGDWGTVSGVVTQNGVPLKKGLIAFHPKEGPSSYGDIGADGSFTVRTGADAGLKTGEYVVTVADQTIPDSTTGEAAKLLTPAKYASPQTSDLRATITRGSNKLQFDLKN